MTVVPEAIALQSPAVDAKLNQMAQQVRQATASARVAQPASPEAVTKSVNDWAKSVQKGVRQRVRKAAKSVGKKAASPRAVQATKAAGSNPLVDAVNSAKSGVDQSAAGDVKPDEFDLD
jgi:uncharacterized protein with von Willebrand factor type A (vWA) domain